MRRKLGWVGQVVVLGAGHRGEVDCTGSHDH
jgi:hypothetical protein